MEKGAIHELQEQMQDLDTLLSAKHNILNKLIDNLHDKFDRLEESTCQIVDAILDLAKKQESFEEKLDRILAYIDKVESPQYKQALDNKEILINLLANAVITRLFAMFNNGQNQ